jgi:hypothetical protein
VERYITDDQGHRTAVILDIEDDKALLRAAEDVEDIRAMDEARRKIDASEVENSLPQSEPTHRAQAMVPRACRRLVEMI